METGLGGAGGGGGGGGGGRGGRDRSGGPASGQAGILIGASPKGALTILSLGPST